MSRPNILLICSDQHTPRVLGCYGDHFVETPNLDGLAAEGTRFDAFYCNNPICGPSRSSLMTGRYPFKCDALTNQSVLDSRTPTLAHMAVRAGYHAVISGKMHFNGPDTRHGFLERLTGELGPQSLHQGVALTPPGLRNLGNCSRPEPLQYTGAGNNALATYDQDVTGSCVRWLEDWAALESAPPFFMVAGLMLPHCPFIARKALYEKYRGRVSAPHYSREQLEALHPHHLDYRRFIQLDDIPPENEDRAAVAYYALVDQLDQYVGELIQALKVNDFWENTIILYTSDHGEMLGQHGRWHKESFYEDSARVPFIVRLPQGRAAESTVNLHSLVDLMPTLCQWVGVEAPPGIDGVAIQPSLEGQAQPDQTVKVETYTHWTAETHGMSSNRMVRRGPWKLCYYGAYDDFELFNLEEDPEEMLNRAGDPACAPVLEELRALIFDDGWSRETAREVAQRLNGDGGWDNIKAYRDALRQSLAKHPRPVSVTDLWERSWTEPTFLDEVITQSTNSSDP